jgi:predicted ATPase/DNA-binding SARP family transcriptional activator
VTVVVTPRIGLLGPPTLHQGDGDGRLAGRQQTLLAVLALRAPQPVRSEVLIDTLWGERLPADPANALQQHVSTLRRRVGQEHLATTGGGYALRVADDDIDARRFERLARRGRDLLRAGDPTGAVTELDAALELWRGDALEGFAHEAWAIGEAARLEEQRLAAEEDRADAGLALGRSEEVVSDTVRRLADHPLRERTAAQLVLALAATGRQADALAVYDRTRRTLVEELGADPGPALQRAHQRVLDDAVHGPGADQPPPAVDQLPAARDRLVGRAADLAALGDLLDEHRLVTVVGPGGAGKSVTALEAARRVARPRDGRVWVDLTDVDDEATLTGHLARALGLAGTGFGSAPIDVPTLVEALRPRRLLVVLDGADRVLAPTAGLADAILNSAPEVQLLVTARTPLRVAGERRWPLAPLGVPEPAEDHDPVAIASAPAVALLLERARAHDPWFTLDADATPAAAALVRRLDGLPLAIELAAGQLRTRTVTEVLRSVEEGTSLAADDRPGPRRHRSLDAVLDRTWHDLPTASRTAWAALSVTSGAVDTEVADALLTAAGLIDPRAALTDLVDRGLVTTDRRGATTSVRTLATLRTFGRARLEDLGLDVTVHRAHAHLVEGALDAAVRDDPARFPVDLARQAAWLDEARGTLRWSHAVGDRRQVQRIAGKLGWVWLLHGAAAEGRSWLDRGLTPLETSNGPPDPSTSDLETVAVLWASGLRVGAADPDAARWARLAAAVARDDAERTFAGVTAAVHALHAGDLEAARHELAVADVPASAVGGWPLGFHRVVRAQVARLTGRLADVRRDAEQALATLDAEVTWARALAVDLLIDADLDAAGEPVPASVLDRARRLATEALGWCTDDDLPELESRLRLQLGRVLHGLGEPELGRHHVDQGLVLARRVGAPVSLGFALLVAGTLAFERGAAETAVVHLEEAERHLGGTGAAYGVVEATVTLSSALHEVGRHLDADAAARRAVRAAADAGDPMLVARADAAARGGDRPVTGP